MPTQNADADAHLVLIYTHTNSRRLRRSIKQNKQQAVTLEKHYSYPTHNVGVIYSDFIDNI